MRVYKFIHSCLVVEEGGDKILFDLGMFSFINGQVTPDAFRDVGTIIITHNHPDHVDVAALQKIVELSGAMVITNSEAQDALTKEGIESMVLDEGSYQSKDFTILAVPANHEKILAPTEHSLSHQRELPQSWRLVCYPAAHPQGYQGLGAGGCGTLDH